jgi:hypothetical protein
MNLSRSIDYLLDRAGPVIQYRLQKEILGSLSPAAEEMLLEQVYLTPHFQLLLGYVKPNGYIGIGMHSWDKFKETPLQDGEAAARLLSYYAVPKEHPVVAGYIDALRDDATMEEEFSYYRPEAVRYENRWLGLNNGAGLMVLVYAMQALLGHGDDEEARPFQDIALKAFESVMSLSTLEDLTTFRPGRKARYNYPYIEEDAYYPCSYHLAALAYTESWRSPGNIAMLAGAINRIDAVMNGNNRMHVKVKSRYYSPLWALTRPFEPFRPETVGGVMYRRVLTEIARLGVGMQADVLRQSADNLGDALQSDGVLRLGPASAYQRRALLQSLRWPGPYTDVGLEPDYGRKDALECEMTFWAVQLLHLCGLMTL